MDFQAKAISKKDKYLEVIDHLTLFLSAQDEFISTLANVSAIIKEAFDFWWVGFYIVKDSNSMYLGPFQGPAACSAISYGKGVCGTAWKERHTLVVPDVHKFPGHIACSSQSLSEIVVPLLSENGNVIGVLDIDSRELNTFDSTDSAYLEELAKLICKTAK